MAFKHGSGADIYINAINFGSYLNSAEHDGAIELADTTNFNSGGARQYLGGQRTMQATYNGLLDPAADTAVRAALGTASSVWTLLPEGDVFAARSWCFAGKPATYKQTAPVGDAVAIAITATGDTAPEIGYILRPLAQVSATGNGSTKDDGGASTDGATSYIHITSGSGSGTVTVSVQHSSDNFATNTTLITHTAVVCSNAPFYERIAFSGAVNEYTRSRVSFNGTGTATIHHSFYRWP